jgi:MFS transporter, SP family, general alpha glucoside:H+ symporter
MSSEDMKHAEEMIEKQDGSPVIQGQEFAEALDAENNEHSMSMWEAAKAYPMACFWAFIFSFTIVSTSRMCSWALVC